MLNLSYRCNMVPHGSIGNIDSLSLSDFEGAVSTHCVDIIIDNDRII
jgi:hypothetical protein